MKALINCAKPECAWPARFFGSINPYMLPVLGKPLIEYYLDWCSLSGMQEVLVVAEEYDEDLSDFVSNGSKWGLDVTVSANSGDASDGETLKRNSNFAEGGVSVMSGFFFPYYDKTAHRSEVSEDPEKRIYTNAKGPRKHDYCKCKPIELESLEKYYRLCMSLLSRGTRHLIMNGYGSEPGVFMGMNVVVMPGAKLAPPFVIGNNVQIEAGTRIGPCVAVGDTCIVDRRTSVENSIVLGKTYVAQDLEIRGKILFGNRIIDPVSGHELEFRDNMFSATLSQGSLARSARRAVEIPLALAIGVSMLPAYAVYGIIGMPKRETMTVAGEGAAECAVFKREPGAKNSWFFKLGLDKLHLLKHVLSGRLRLIGDSVWSSRDAREILPRYKHYEPGVFTYADSLGHSDHYEILIDDLFYKHSRSLKNDMQVLLRTIVARLLTGDKSDEV